MNKTLILFTILACGSCVPLSQGSDMPLSHGANIRRASSFVYDPDLPPITADGFRYDPNMPALHASNFIPTKHP